MRFTLLILLVLSVSGLTSCSNGDEDDRRYPVICDGIIECGAMTRDNCMAVYGPFVFSDACIQAAGQASCEEHQQAPPPYFDTCFPPCMGVESTCLGDEITVCSQGRTKVSLCGEVCKMSGKKYTGVCGREHGEEVSPTGLDMCWCE